MFSNILLAVDGSDLSLRAARQGISLANSLKARVVVLTVTIPSSTDFARELAVVVPEVVVPHREYDAKREAATARILHQVVSEAHAAGVRARPLHRCHHDPYRAIVATALHEACDLIVIGSPCRSIGGAVLGGEAMRILNHTTVPVLVCRGS
jgi:nucleotide-binding universal stress UspA family protein